jgi:hypothetical protein
MTKVACESSPIFILQGFGQARPGKIQNTRWA